MNIINLAGCVILKGDALLLLHRIKIDWFELPGGKIDPGERAEQAAIRELKEELLCDVEIIKMLGNKDFQENGYVMNYTWFFAKIKEGQSVRVGEKDKFNEFRYIPVSDLKKYILSTNMQNFVKELESGSISLP
jgi:8-oxo-dGTP pyrophosphatase MutT (NUDIX family)